MLCIYLAKDNNSKYSTALVPSSANNINTDYHKLTSDITDIIETKNFKKMRRACYEAIRAIDSTLPVSLIDNLKPTKSSDDMLDVLAQSPYWNWFDTRLLQALVSASGSAEPEALLEQFKQIHYSRRVNEVLPYVSVVPLKDSVTFVEKFNKEAHELTLRDIVNHKHILEYEVLDTRDKMVLCYIKIGCVELTWQVPQELVYRAYTSMKRKNDELSSLAVKSLVCKEADEYVGLPILWRRQEVGEVGPIEPLPEHVRQEPYSLPQGFQWVTLSSSDVEEVVKFINKQDKLAINNITCLHSITHPHTRSEWQFGIRTTNGKLVGVVLAYPVCMSIGGVSVMCVCPTIYYHRKYYNKRLFYILNKELQRRINLNKINQFLCFSTSRLFAPVVTITMWLYDFTHPTSVQLPNSPRTPGWRKMISEDVPSVLALVNKYSSQFEIRQVFTSKEEFSHFLCPAIPNHVFTYVVENENNNITDLVSFAYRASLVSFITMMVYTQTPPEDLIRDAIICARQNGFGKVVATNLHVEEHVLQSLSFSYSSSRNYCFYNYKYHQLSEMKCWIPCE